MNKISEDTKLAKNLVRLIRPHNNRFGVLLIILPSIVANNWSWRIVPGVFALISLYGIATIYNDLQDMLIDKANKRDLPLVRGELTKDQAKYFLTGLVVCLVLVNFIAIQPNTLNFSLIYALLLFCYSNNGLRFSHRGLLATITLGVCYFSLPYLLGASYTSGLNTSNILLSLSGCLFAMSALLFKDFKDELGDRMFDKKTPLIRYGEQRVYGIALFFYILGASVLVIKNVDFVKLLMLVGMLVFLVLAIKHKQLRPVSLQLYALCAVILMCT